MTVNSACFYQRRSRSNGYPNEAPQKPKTNVTSGLLQKRTNAHISNYKPMIVPGWKMKQFQPNCQNYRSQIYELVAFLYFWHVLLSKTSKKTDIARCVHLRSLVLAVSVKHASLQAVLHMRRMVKIIFWKYQKIIVRLRASHMMQSGTASHWPTYTSGWRELWRQTIVKSKHSAALVGQNGFRQSEYFRPHI